MADLMRMKYENPRLEQCELANQLGDSPSTLQRYRNDINMPSLYRNQPNNTEEQAKKDSNTSFDNNSQRNLDVKRHQMTSKYLKLTSNESVKNKRNKLEGGDPSESENDGRNFSKKFFQKNSNM